MKTIKDKIEYFFNGIVDIKEMKDGYTVYTKNISVTNSTINRIKDELKCKDIRISVGKSSNLLMYELFFEKITDRIKTFADAWEYCGKPEKPTFTGEQKQIRYFQAIYQMTIICKALNEDWIADWDNDNEPKYYPYFYMSPSGFAFCGTLNASTLASAGCGSNFRLKKAELSQYCGKQFIDIWKVIQEGF